MSIVYEQIDLFSNKEFGIGSWTKKDFLNALKSEGVESFQQALLERGIQKSIVESISRLKPKELEQAVDFALSWQNKPLEPFVRGSTQEAIEANKSNEAFKLFQKHANKHNSLSETFRDILQPVLERWAGEDLCRQASFSSWRVEGWLEELADACAFIDEAKAMNAELVSVEKLKIGDILYISHKNGHDKALVLAGEYKPWNDGVFRGRVTILLQTPQDPTPFGVAEGALTYSQWLSHHPLLKALMQRHIIGSASDKFYRVGHTDKQITSIKNVDEEVQEAFRSLPLPETPETLWEIFKGRKDDWLEYFHKDVVHDAMDYHMTQYGIEHAQRLLDNHNPPLQRRGSHFDHLPDDEMIKPMVDDLVNATTLDEVEEILARYWWVNYKYGTGRIYSLGRTIDVYQPLYKAGITRTQDRKLITRILQQMSINAGNFAVRIAKWTPTDGVIIFDPEEDEFIKRHRDEKLNTLQNGVFLGVYCVDKEDVEDEDLIVSDDDDIDEMDEDEDCTCSA